MDGPKRLDDMRARFVFDTETGVGDLKRGPARHPYEGWKEALKRGANLMDEAKRRQEILKHLPEKVSCPACLGDRVKCGVVCVKCTRLLGQCAAVLDYIPTGLIGPEDEGVESPLTAEVKGVVARAEATLRAAGEEARDVAARVSRKPLTLTPEEEALLAPSGGQGSRYPTREASKKALRLGTRITAKRKEALAAAQAGDREALDAALGILTVLLETRAELRHRGPEDRAPVEEAEDAARVEAPADPTPTPEPPRSSIYFEVVDTNQGHRIAEHLENIARSLRSDLGQFDAEVRIRRLARNGAGNGRVAG